MKILRTVDEMQKWALQARRRGYSLGFVPTMGALHEGHLSLIRRARRETDAVIASIFVNPLQFGPKEDFKKYPRPWGRDLSLLKKERVDVLFAPNAREMYRDGAATRLTVGALGSVLEGKFRPGHFDGVATVVTKLFQATQPSKAYFGEKDYQQLRVIEQTVSDLNLPIDVVACRTVREKDGLACSSRNRYLSRKEREEAVKIYQALFLAKELVTGRIMTQSSQLIKRLGQVYSKIPHSKVDYAVVVDPKTLVPMTKIKRPAVLLTAVRIGKTRLIDNIYIP